MYSNLVENSSDSGYTSIILFPGQGNQFVGMAKDLLKFPKVRDLFERANNVLQYDLLKICLEGPKSKLDETRYCQPAVVVCSLAAIERLKEEMPDAISNCVATAGFSLGEITALVFAGAIEFETALHLVKIRAEGMQLASETFKGGMLKVLYGPESDLNGACEKAKEWARVKGDTNSECTISNYLYPYCKYVAGSESAIEYLEKNYKLYNLKEVNKIPVSGSFHSGLMALAVEPLRRALNQSDIKEPKISVFSNVDGKRYENADQIKRQLPEHIVKPVKWEQLLHEVYKSDGEHFPTTFECGPGGYLKGILKEVNAKACDNYLIIPV